MYNGTKQLRMGEGVHMNKKKETKKFVTSLLLFSIIIIVNVDKICDAEDYFISAVLSAAILSYGIITIFIWNKLDIKIIDIMLLILDIVVIISSGLSYYLIGNRFAFMTLLVIALEGVERRVKEYLSKSEKV